MIPKKERKLRGFRKSDGGFGFHQPAVEAAGTDHKLLQKSASGITGIYFPWTEIKSGDYHHEKS
jgi:hypothetical protein